MVLVPQLIIIFSFPIKKSNESRVNKFNLKVYLKKNNERRNTYFGYDKTKVNLEWIEYISTNKKVGQHD